jgi:hypothetical protein
MKAIRRPQLGDGFSACCGVRFGPNRNVTIGKFLSFIHDPLPDVGDVAIGLARTSA